MRNKKTFIGLATIAIVVIIILLIPKKSEETIQIGDTVSIDYTITLQDGRIFAEDTESIIVGNGTVPWIDSYLVGSKSWDILTITIPASETYERYYNPALIQRMPIYTLTQAWITAEEDTFIIFWSNRYYIQSIENDVVSLDGNPIHTRQDMDYTISITQLEKSEE